MISWKKCMRLKKQPESFKDVKWYSDKVCDLKTKRCVPRKITSAAGALYGIGSPDGTALLVGLTIEPTTPITVFVNGGEFSVPVDFQEEDSGEELQPAPTAMLTGDWSVADVPDEELDPPMEGIPPEICDCLRLLAWHRGEFGRYNPNERWEAKEDDPQEFCDFCGGTPMCVVCMEYDLAMWEDYRIVTPEQALCLLNVNEYLQSIYGENEYYEAAAIYWIAHWDGFNLRNMP